MTIHVACAARGAYVEHSLALVRSIAENGGYVHYLHAADFAEHAAVTRAARGAADFHAVDEARVADLPVRDYFTSAMWFRLLLPELVGAERVLYLDADTLVMDDLDELWATDLGGALAGAVANVWQPDHVFHAGDLGIAPEDYFNSGVLLLDLERMRGEDTMAEVHRVALERAGLRGWPDQDALNLVLAGRWHALDPRWNTMNASWASHAPDTPELAAARERPGIRHFEGPEANKPWVADPPHAEAWRQALTASRQV